MKGFRFVVIALLTALLTAQASAMVQTRPAGMDDGRKGKKALTEEEWDQRMSVDGPYIIYGDDGSARVITVNGKGKVKDKVYAKGLPADYSFKVTDHEGNYPFEVRLHAVERPAWKFERPDSVFVMSDPHGRLDCVVSLLQGNGIIDGKLHWNFGTNHLVIIGDIFDRGYDATQIFWLVYQLEQEAADAGGQLTFLLGNHEPFILDNDLRYTKRKYHMLADTLGVEYARLWAADTELGRWLGTRGTMQVIGRDLYVHAGLGREFYEWNLTIPQVNEEMSRALFLKKPDRRALSPLTKFLYGNSGPIWYRGLVREDAKYHPMPADSLQMVLDRYETDRLFVGHTIFDDISSFYNGRVIDVNVDNKINREARRGRAVLLVGDKTYVVGDEGVMRELE